MKKKSFYNKAKFRFVISLFLLLYGHLTYGQTNITGKVLDEETKEALIGVNIVVKGKVIGTTTNIDGVYKFQSANLTPPFTLVFSVVGYETQEINISENQIKNNEVKVDVNMPVKAVFGQEVVISASRVEENIMKSPVSVEKMDILAVQNTPTDNYYKGLANLKGVDVTTSSIGFQILNARGFNSTGNTRFVQLIDGMDTQAPALNFPIGNLNGPTELDVESTELIPGAASALYGPNAFNGILLVKSKNPFEYQGLSAYVKSGFNHFGGNGALGEPTSPQWMPEAAFRYAKAINDKFAFKANVSYWQAMDWHGVDYSDVAKDKTGKDAKGNLLSVNPAQDQIHGYGEAAQIALPLLGFSSGFRSIVTNAYPQLLPYLGSLPNQVVARTPYREVDVADYNAKNMKASGSIHYRLNDNLELSYAFNGGFGTSIYTGANRYSLKNFGIQQHKLELRGDNFFTRAYTTIENSGDSYIIDAVAANINNEWSNNSNWFATYGISYLAGMAQLGFQPGAQLPASIQSQLHQAARAQADLNRYAPGSDNFNKAKDKYANELVPNGGRFNDQSRFYHWEGQYDFKNEIKFMDLQVGGSYRLYDLRSNGTIFADKDKAITIQEWGAYAQASKKLFDDKLKLTASGRYDKNENFEGQFNPRVSGVWSINNNHNIRGSVQTGFRLPSTQAQHISLDVGSLRILGGLPFYQNGYNPYNASGYIYENAYTLASVNRYTNAVIAAGTSSAVVDPRNLALLEKVDKLNAVKPEQVRSFEVGYKGLIGNKLMIDAAYYYNIYTNFITQAVIRVASGDISKNPLVAQSLLANDRSNAARNNSTFQVYTNLSEELRAHGAVLGLSYSLPEGYTVNANYNYNALINGFSDAFMNDFNTPPHKLNLGLANRKVTEKVGFSLNWRWQEEFLWQSSFANGKVPAYSTFDAQISYRVPEIKSVFKIGGSNILNQRYIQSIGSPNIGSIYYVSITFDQLMNK